MTIILSGGGSGGHITPILAVANELKKLQPDIRLVYIGQRGDSLADIPAEHPAIDKMFLVSAGKFRRYSGEGWRQLFDVGTQAKNVRDAFRVLLGIWQSYWLMRKLKPAIIFTRGGFVSVPVAFGGKLRGVPYITHDSDSTPSLANRVIAPWAEAHAVALPEDVYPYPRSKTIMVGVPVSGDYVRVTPKLKLCYRSDLGLKDYDQMLFVTGGGNGADQLNRVVARNIPRLLERYPGLVVVHVAGRALESSVNHAYDALLSVAERQRVIVKGFVTDLYRYSGAADVLVIRAGATGLAEFALQAKACIVVPSKQLLWQAKHAETLAKRQAILELSEQQSEDGDRLAKLVIQLFDDDKLRHALGLKLSQFARPDAAKRLAMLLLEKAEKASLAS